MRLEIDVRRPTRTDSVYEFHCLLRPVRSLPRELLGRAKRTILRRPRWPGKELRFGFRALNYRIQHDEIWDGIYPLLFLTRNGGPLFNTRYDRATIRFAYPVARPVVEFYVRRAAAFGLEIRVEADTAERTLDHPTDGHVLAFGGGKDSRLLLGLLRELGHEPLPVTAGARYATDVPESRITESINGALTDRLMPGLMSLGRHFHVGNALNAVHRVTPWQQYFDWASAEAVGEFSLLLAALGVDLQVHVPAAVLPSNLVQRILYERYPELYRHQRSVEKDEPTEKNLDVSLGEATHGIPFHHHCREPLFVELLERFVRRQTEAPLDFGYRGHREVVHREMRALIFRNRLDARFAGVRNLIPDQWEATWIDYIHPYVAPALSPEFLEIFALYAPRLDGAAAGPGLWRIPV